MRIIGGSAAGRRLSAPRGMRVRPTPDLVRQAIFNRLGERVLGARVLELFGGTGALSLECLSRGAASAVCIERCPRHARCIQQNARDAGLAAAPFHVRVQDVFLAMPQLAAEGRRFDLILADPPFGEKNLGRRSDSLSQQLLDNRHLPPLLAPGGWLILGHAKRDRLAIPEAWREDRTLKHGDSQVCFLSRIDPRPPGATLEGAPDETATPSPS
ncbi:MAG: RsmD family RNA methyltransferase [Verrucomicrobia bacterium]|nr:RsmD family RNA methyltransferase [Verrucomicrobiota bacterium]